MAATRSFMNWPFFTLLGVLGLMVTATGRAQDTVVIGDLATAAVPGSEVELPVYINDVSGTLLGMDVGPNFLIQGLAINIEVTPGSAITAISADRAGITAALTPQFETDLAVSNRYTWIITFDEKTATIPFALDAAPPGDLVARLNITLADNFGAGGLVQVDPIAPTGLGNQPPGVPETAFSETVENGFLALTGGTITVMESLFSDGFESGDTSAWSITLP